MRLWFLTNGQGEDRATSLVAAAAARRRPDVELLAATLVTSGTRFIERRIPVVISGAPPPSGGFPNASIAALLQDARVVPSYGRFVRQLRRLTGPGDIAVAGGDTFLLALARLAFRQQSVHLALAKSVYGQPHSRVEHVLLRRWASLVLARDEATADALRAHGVRAEFLGNPLIDRDAEPARATRSGAVCDGASPPVVLLLPGSRTEAPGNLARLLAIVSLVEEPARWVCAWSDVLSTTGAAEAARAGGWEVHDDCLIAGARSVTLLVGEFDALLRDSSLVLGLAGTANEQAAAEGKPVVTFVGAGPQTCAKRMREQERLLGGAARFVDGQAAEIAAEISTLLRSPQERERRGRLGIARLGARGAAVRIAERLLAEVETRRADCTDPRD